MLVETHGPERDDLSFRVGVVIGEALEFGLEILDVLIGVALGEFGDEVQGVGLEALFEIIESDQPMAPGLTRRLLIDHVLL